MDTPDRKSQSKVREVFTDVQGHILTAEIIRRHSTNKEDIRSLPLRGLSLEGCKNILDLGCGFGFFTQALKGRVHTEASVTGIDVIEKYEPIFLETSKKAGLKGTFQASGASTIKTLRSEQYDLILCSYALYFFPEVIHDISRILSRNGRFITITHRKKNMGELIDVIKGILTERKVLRKKRLPVEEVIEKFSGENGLAFLMPWFGNVQTIDYKNSLTFQMDEILSLVAYFKYKSPFFLAGIDLEAEAVSNLLSTHLQKSLSPKDSFIMSKDDTIFICSAPLYGSLVRHEKENS